jgi:antibiotic biosynthesis monooxygenase (ABM) superfamily enzyme
LSIVIPVDPSQPLVHVAILRKVRKGHEAEFEAKLAAFLDEAEHEAGMCDSYLIRPGIGAHAPEYGVLRTFRSEADMRRFYDSTLFARWQDEVRPLVEGDGQMRELHGLEAFFQDTASPPPLWKMALLTWVAVNPLAYLFAQAVPAILGPLPVWAGLLIVNSLVIVSLVWGLMPALTRIFRRWLQPNVP